MLESISSLLKREDFKMPAQAARQYEENSGVEQSETERPKEKGAQRLTVGNPQRWQKGCGHFWNFYGPESAWQIDAWLMAISYYLFHGDPDRQVRALKNDREEMARLLEVCMRRNKNLESESDVTGALRERCTRVAGCTKPALGKLDLSDVIPPQEFRREQHTHAQYYSIGSANYLRPSASQNKRDPN